MSILISVIKRSWPLAVCLLFLNDTCGTRLLPPSFDSKIYPNPCNDYLMIECSYYQYPQIVKLELFGKFRNHDSIVFKDILKYDHQKFRVNIPQASAQQIVAKLSIGYSVNKYYIHQKGL